MSEYAKGREYQPDERAKESDPSWRLSAACRNMPAELFFSEVGGNTVDRAAKAVCNGCQSRVSCLDYAMTTRQTTGIWGGMSAKQRHAMRRRAARQRYRRGLT